MSRQREIGWFARERAAKARLEAAHTPQLAANLRDADDRLRAEREAAAAFAVSQEEKRRETLCGCPACGATGELTEAEAALVANALAYFRSKSLAVDPVFFDKGKMLPRPVRADAPVIPASETGTDEEAEALAELVSETPRKKPRHTPPPPFLAD